MYLRRQQFLNIRPGRQFSSTARGEPLRGVPRSAGREETADYHRLMVRLGVHSCVPLGAKSAIFALTGDAKCTPKRAAQQIHPNSGAEQAS